MCVEVHNLETNKTACTVKDLARMLDVPLQNMYTSLSGMAVDVNSCLCQLDVFGACNKAGLSKVYDIEIKKKL